MTAESNIIDRAIIAKLKRYVVARLAEGHTQLAIGADLGVDRAMVSKYKDGAAASIKPATARALAGLLGLPDVGALEREALAEFKELPPRYTAAQRFLEDTHRRSFEEATFQHFERSSAHGGTFDLSIEELARQIYEQAQLEKGKVVGFIGVPTDNAPTGAAALKSKRKPK